MTKTTEQLNTEAKQLQLEKENQLRNSTFTGLPSKNYDKKLDLFVRDVSSDLNKIYGELTNIRENLNNQINLTMFLAELTIQKGFFANIEELNSSFESFLDGKEGFRALTEADVVQPHDKLTVSFTGYDLEGKPSNRMSATNYTFNLSFTNFVPEFENQFLGMRVGESKTGCPVTFPEDYHVKEMAGNTYTFDFTVSKAKRNVEFEKTFLKNQREILMENLRNVGVTDFTSYLDFSNAELQAKLDELTAQQQSV